MILFLIKSGICLAALLLFYHLVLRKENMFSFSRYFLLASLVYSLLVPVLTFPSFFPSIDGSGQKVLVEFQKVFLENDIQYPNEESRVLDPKVVKPMEKSSSVDWYWILGLVYMLGVLFFLMRFIFQIMGLAKLIRKGSVVAKEKYKLVQLSQETLPFTFLNYLFVNEITYLRSGIEPAILKHELTHIREKHSLDILFVEVLKIIFWFNPLFLLYKKAIQLNHEFLADRAVIAGSLEVFQYQKLLISKVLGEEFVYNLSSPINYSVTKNRLIMMRKHTSKRKSLFLKVGLIPVLTLLLGAFSQSAANQEKTFSLTHFFVKDFETYISEALSEKSDFVLELEKLDILGAKAVYLMLTEEEKSRYTEFPILEDEALSELLKLQKAKDSIKVRINFSSPPEKMSISEEVWDNWLKSINLEVILDEKEEDASILLNYSPEDFALFEVRGVEKKKFLKPEKFRLTLTTHDHFQDKFITSRKKINTISAAYPNGDIAEIPYYMRYVLMNSNGELEEYYPENYLQRALEAILTHEFENSPSTKVIYDVRKSFWINVTRNGQKEMVAISYN